MGEQVIDYQWLVRPTGNPFVDTGGFVIKILWERYNYPKDIFKLIEEVAKIYIYNWDAELHSFFLNSTITHNSTRGQPEKKMSNTLNYYKSLIEGEADYGVEGICSITGRKTKVYPARRDNSILTGAMSFANFHSFFSPGVWFSAEVLIRMFFLPLGSVQVGAYNAVVLSDVQEFTEFIVAENVKNNLKSSLAHTSKGVYKLNYNFAGNALFHYVNLLLDDRKLYDRLAVFTLYHFSNFANKTYLKVYHLPSEVFRFYSFCHLPHLKAYWKKFLRSHYKPTSKYSGAKFDLDREVFVYKNKDSEQILGEEEYISWSNSILNALLNGSNLMRDFKEWFKKGNYLPFQIIEAYSKIILKMKEQTINKVKQLAEFIIQVTQERGDIKRHLNALSQATRASDLRAYLLKLVRLNYERNAEQPLITVDEYVDYLFSDDIGWGEVRDLLLLAVYEQLHKKQIFITLDEEQPEEV